MSLLKALAWMASLMATAWIIMLGAIVVKYGTDAGWRSGLALTVERIHGALFFCFFVLLVLNHVKRKWPRRKSLRMLGAAIIPGGGYWITRQALDEDARTPSPSPA